MKKINKKIIISIFILIILIIFGFTYFSNISNQNNTIEVGTTKFILPNGYKYVGISDLNAVAIDNGSNTIYLSEINDSNVTKYVNDYEKIIKEKNQTMIIQNITHNNIIYYKSVNFNSPNTTHYWFVKNNKTYSVFAYDGNTALEEIVFNFYDNMS